MYFYLVTTTLLMQITCIYALDCYRCSNVSSTDQCHSTVLCRDNERCFAHVFNENGNTTYTLACKTIDQCPLPTTISSVSIVGRSVSQRNCTQCCDNDGCNKKLCSKAVAQVQPCTDDPKLDCAAISSVFDICKDIVYAQSVCRKFCRLCDFADSAWSQWSNWGTCDVTCGPGHIARTRTCSNPAPGHGGLDCDGDSFEQRVCSLEKCPIHGQWSNWSEWSACSITCGVGVQHHYHSCNSPAPSPDGDPCFGARTDTRICFEKACIYGGWSKWTEWSRCSATCGTGINTRSRLCDSPVPSLLGDCNGKDHEVELCNITDCVDVSDCYEIKQLNSSATTGIYTVWPHLVHVQVFCDMDTDGGGWTVFQHRFNGSVDFYRNFSDYEKGFGDLRGEFWLGLLYIQEMTSNNQTELRLDLEAANGSTVYETYQNFSLLGDSYTLHIGQSAGTAGDVDGLTYHNGQVFSTYDRDNKYDCAVTDHGGWWYKICASVNLNGNYATPGTLSHYGSGQGGVIYFNFTQHQSLKMSKMMFRRN